MPSEKTPASLGYAMPAEWTQHEATWLGWPHNKNDWPGKIIPIHWVYGEIIRKLSPGEKVRLLVPSARDMAIARRVCQKAGAVMENVEFVRWPTDRGWTRDFGPIFVKGNKGVAVVDFRFNAWAKYPDNKKDDAIAKKAAQKLRLECFDARHFVLEGGAIDVNGKGTLITTEECLLDAETQVRNPGWNKQWIEQSLCDYLGVTNILWLNKGIAGDDTHGHVDDLCRFVNPTTIVICKEDDPRDANYALLRENIERLRGMKLENGNKPEIVTLPMPRPVVFDGQRLPASYANFYIANGTVLVPTFNDPADRVALGILAELFPGRTVVGIHAVDLVWGLGTLHCLTQQQPAA